MGIIYLDNAATSHFKPKAVIDAVTREIINSSNSGRSGHSLAVSNSLKIERCRHCLMDFFGAGCGYNLVFTKNCTEALNLAIFGLLERGDHAVATCYEHNSVLRPLFELKRRGLITLDIVTPKVGKAVTYPDIADKILPSTKLVVINLVSNVTGTVCGVEEISQKLSANFAEKRPRILVDGAQGVPIIPVDMGAMNLDMLAAPAHKGLHGIQGLGFLIFKSQIALKPLLFGGTGTASDSMLQPPEAPEAFEAGTQFSAGIHALYEGAKWSFENVCRYSETVLELSQILLCGLKELTDKIYTSDPRCGVVSFNLDGIDSALLSDILSREYSIATRSGLHCAPLVHKQLGTCCGGALRCSLGADTTKSDIYAVLSALKEIKKLHLKNSDCFD
jgi:cysteine desulfurase/selenocysteine lyase